MVMNNNKDPMDQMIVDDLLKEAASIDEEIEKANVESMPPDLKEKIKEKLHRQMEEQERERIYAQLSEEDRKALELGREMLRKEEKVVRRKRCRKVYVAVAAVAILVLAMGITSVGGAERVIEMVKIAIGDRELVKVNTDEENYIVRKDVEEEAYQEIKDVFGVEAVKPTDWPDGTVFVEAEIDEKLQIAVLKYEYNKELVNYLISTRFTTSSWGIDIEDEMTDNYYIELDETKIQVKEYKRPKSQIKMYSARYSYKGLEYLLIGTLDKSDFEVLIKNLRFF